MRQPEISPDRLDKLTEPYSNHPRRPLIAPPAWGDKSICGYRSRIYPPSSTLILVLSENILITTTAFNMPRDKLDIFGKQHAANFKVNGNCARRFQRPPEETKHGEVSTPSS